MKHHIFTVKQISAGLISTVLLVTLVGATTTIDLHIQQAVQYLQRIVLTDNGGASGKATISLDGQNGSIQAQSLKLHNSPSIDEIQPGAMESSDTSLATTSSISGFVHDQVKSALLADYEEDPLFAQAEEGLVHRDGEETINGSKTFTNDVIVENDLYIQGAFIRIQSEQITTENKTISLADTVTPTDITANGGGIIIQSETPKTLTRQKDSDSRTSSEHFNLPAGKHYLIDGTPLIDAQELNIPYFYQDRLLTSTLRYKRNNLGVNTENPQSTLHIAGNIQIGHDLSICDQDHAGAIAYQELEESSDLIICMKDGPESRTRHSLPNSLLTPIASE